MLAFDTETYLIRPGNLTPKLVCLSYDLGNNEMGVLGREDDPVAFLRRYLDSETPMVGHNVAFDLAVCAAEEPDLLPLIFRAYDEGRIYDTMVRQKLLDIAEGELEFYLDGKFKRVPTSHSLQKCVERHFGRYLPKDTWRLRYAELDGIPISKWPKGAHDYALLDAVEARNVYLAQEAFLDGDVLEDEALQTKSAWSLHLMSAWGVRTDTDSVDRVRDEFVRSVEDARKKLRQEGLIRGKKDSRNMEAIRTRLAERYAALGKELSHTPTGKIQTEASMLRAANDPVLELLADYSGDLKNLTTYVPVLLQGRYAPINARYNVLVATGRTSCGDPNMQNPPRKGGIRECFIPRPGFLYAGVDYDTIELRSLAQACLDILGYSEMAEALRAGKDLHVDLAAEIMGEYYENMLEKYEAGDPSAVEMRQFAKIGMFGLPGGMGEDALLEYALGYGVVMTKELAGQIVKSWHRKWPEMRNYFRHINSVAEAGVLVQLRSKRVRGDVGYTQAANSYFQGLTADGVKDALYAVTKECYVDPASPLFGSRPVIFLHDEIICEVPEDRAHEAAHRQAEVMIEVMQRWLPDVPVTAKPVLMDRWWKGAKPVYENGRLVPWRPAPQKEAA